MPVAVGRRDGVQAGLAVRDPAAGVECPVRVRGRVPNETAPDRDADLRRCLVARPTPLHRRADGRATYGVRDRFEREGARTAERECDLRARALPVLIDLRG